MLKNTCTSRIINKIEEIYICRVAHTAVETWLDSSDGPSLANPKSDNFAFQCSSRRMLDVFMSRNIICEYMIFSISETIQKI